MVSEANDELQPDASKPKVLTLEESKRLLERVERLETRLRESHFRQARRSGSDIERRIGSILIQSAKKPWKWPHLPLQLYRAVKFHRQLSAGISNRDPVARAVALFFEKAKAFGIQAALADFDLNNSLELDRQSLFVKASELAYLKGNSELELLFAEHSVAIDENAQALARVVSAQMDLDNVSKAFDASKALKRIGGHSEDWRVKAAIKEVGSGPLSELDCLDLLEKKGVTSTDFESNRICYILHAALPFTSNGYATRSHAVATAMRENNWEVTCLTRPGYPWDMRPDAIVSSDSINVDGIPYVFSSSKVSARTCISDYMAESVATLEKHLSSLKPALVVAASNYRVGLMALIACRKLGIPIVYEVRGRWEVTRLSRDPEFIYSHSYKVQNYLEGLVAREVDAVWTLTGGLKRLLVEQGVPAAKISMLPNGANSELFIPQDRDAELAGRLGIPDSIPIFGYIGSFVDYEGLDDLVDAAGILKKEGYDFRLLLVGNESPSGESRGGLSQLLRDLAIENGLGDWLIMPGRVQHDEVASYYSLVDIAPFPRKGLPVCELVSPLKPLEAMAMEKILIVTDVMALAEIVENGACGIVVQKNSVVALFNGMKKAISELKEPTGMARHAKTLVETERSWHWMLGRLQNELLALVSKRK